MDLILWRHAEAVESGVDLTDLERPLTARGERQAARMAAWLNRQLPATTRVLASPARRTQQTAQALERKFRTVPAIAPEATPEAVLDAARRAHAAGATLVATGAAAAHVEGAAYAVPVPEAPSALLAPVLSVAPGQLLAWALARAKGLDARLMDAAELRFDEAFDAAFSNATLHWVLDKERAARAIWHALKTGARFAGEMGGSHNLSRLRRALDDELVARGYGPPTYASNWYPTVDEFTAIYEAAGFRDVDARLIERPTPLDHPGQDVPPEVDAVTAEHVAQRRPSEDVDPHADQVRRRPGGLLDEVGHAPVVRDVHVYDGSARIAAHQFVNLSGSLPFVAFGVAHKPDIFWGVGISIGVATGGGTPEQRRMDVISAGVDFLD